MKKRKTGGQQIDLMRSALRIRWSRFSYERTPKRKREWLYGMRDNHVSVSYPAHCCPGDKVTMICEQAQNPISIHRLSTQLNKPVFSRGGAIFESAWSAIDKIAHNYQNMFWWVSEDGLIMEAIIPQPPALQTFEQVAGKLMLEARASQSSGRYLSKAEYRAIAKQLSAFRPLLLLPAKYRRMLGDWNKKNPQRAIHTFSNAIEANRPKGLRRAVKRLLYRAEKKVKAVTASEIL